MRKDITLAAQPRETRGKNEARRLRVQKLSPAVLYGAGKDPVAVSISPKEVGKILNSSSGVNTIFNLDVQGVENTPVMVADWQVDPVREHILHVDLKRVDLTKRISVFVAVHYHGEPTGVKIQGGHLEVVNRAIEVNCLPDDIPEHFDIQIGELMVGQAVRAADVPLKEGTTLVSAGEQVLVHVVGHKEEAAAPVEGAAATAEPEVIKKGKKEAEGEAPAAEKGKKK
ncbi:MAG: 50S ribosomal protein L25 [Acidobacteria bacterium]|nr:50S ribosomal protein L25 [Acidobacteriota bacterium]